MSSPERIGHVAVCYNKYFLVWGGYQEDIYPGDQYLKPSRLWVFDTEIQKWSQTCLHLRTVPGHMYEKFPLGTSGATANLHGGVLYVFGGHNMYGHSNLLLHLRLDSWKWDVLVDDGSSPQPSPRDKHSSWLYNDSLYIWGGYGSPPRGYLNENGEFLHDESTVLGSVGWNNQLLILDLKDYTWRNPRCKGPAPVPRAAHATARVGSQVYLFGGRHKTQRLGDLHRLDLDSLTWSGVLDVFGDRPVGRSWHSLVTVSQSMLFLYGGYTSDNKPLADAWMLDVEVLQWTQIQVRGDNPRLWHTCCVSEDGDILVFGGCSSDILDNFSPTMHCSDLLEFRLSPKSLSRLCTDAVFENRRMTFRNWPFLPMNLRALLQRRLEASDEIAQKSDGTIWPIDTT